MKEEERGAAAEAGREVQEGGRGRVKGNEGEREEGGKWGGGAGEMVAAASLWQEGALERESRFQAAEPTPRRTS